MTVVAVRSGGAAPVGDVSAATGLVVGLVEGRRGRAGYDRRADMWEATVGRHASRVVDEHLAEAFAELGPAVNVVDLGAGTARALDRFARLGVDPVTYLGVERDPVMVQRGVARTSRSAARVVRGDIERLHVPTSVGPQLVLLTWVLSELEQHERALELARRAAGRGGRVVVAAVTTANDRVTALDAWIRRRWRLRPVDPTVLTTGARRFSVTLGGRAVVATLDGSSNDDGAGSTPPSSTTRWRDP